MELASTFGLDLELDGIWIDTGWDGSGLKWIGQGWKHFPDYFSHGRYSLLSGPSKAQFKQHREMCVCVCVCVCVRVCVRVCVCVHVHVGVSS